MNSSLPIVLGIDPGSRQIGTSVLKGEELIFYGVKTIKGGDKRETLAKMKAIISSLITEYGITYIAVENVTFIQQHRSFVKIVFEELMNFLNTKKIPHSEYNPKIVRQILCETEKRTKRNTFLILAYRYPELSRYLDVSRVWQKRYFSPMLKAVAVGLVCVHEIQKNNTNFRSTAGGDNECSI